MAPGHRVSARFTFRSSAELIDALAGERQTMPSINATFIDRAVHEHMVVHLDVSPYRPIVVVRVGFEPASAPTRL